MDTIREGADRRIGVGRPERPAVGWTEIGIGLGSYLLLTAVGVGAFLLAGRPPPVIVGVLASAVTALAAVAIAAAVRVRSLAALGLRTVPWRWVALGAGAGVLGWAINRGVILGYVAITGDTGNPQQGLADAAAGSVIGLLGLLAVGAVVIPVAEELLFRGVLYGGLRRYGVARATIVSAAVFGLAHGPTVVALGAFVLGVIMALVYERTGSLWPAVVAHGVNNAILFVTAAVLLG